MKKERTEIYKNQLKAALQHLIKASVIFQGLFKCIFQK